MKKISLSLLFLIAFAVFVNGQNSSPEQVSEHLAKNMSKALKLDKAHAAIAQKVLFDKLTTLHTLSKQLPDENVERSMQVERRKFLTEIKAAFTTDEQFQAWQKLAQDQANRLRNHEKVEDPIISEELLLQ